MTSISTRVMLAKWRLGSWWRETVPLWIARRLPKRLQYWVVIATASSMSCSPEHEHEEVPEQTVMGLLKWIDHNG